MSQNHTTVVQQSQFEKDVKQFIQAIIMAWGETNITHYMVCHLNFECYCIKQIINTCLLFFTQHILFAHGGSLEIFSTQGMEKSHYRARGVYFKNTRHGGGIVRTTYLVEMFNWFYRTTFSRVRSRERAHASNIARQTHLAARASNSQRWRNSTCPVRHATWRHTMIRQGKLWVKNT